MNDKAETQAAPVQPIFDRTPQPFGDGLPDPIVYDGSAQAVRQRTVNFAAKRFADMLYVSGLDRDTAARHFRWRAVALPGGLNRRPAAGDQAVLDAAYRAGHITAEPDNTEQRVTVSWDGPDFQRRVVGAAIARPNYGGILLGPHAVPAFHPQPIERQLPGGRPCLALRIGGGNAAATAGEAGRSVAHVLRQLRWCLRHPDRIAGANPGRAL